MCNILVLLALAVLSMGEKPTLMRFASFVADRQGVEVVLR